MIPHSLISSNRILAGGKGSAAIPIAVTRLLRANRNGMSAQAGVLRVISYVLVRLAVFHGGAP
jgi:hypothetical protein